MNRDPSQTSAPLGPCSRPALERHCSVARMAEQVFDVWTFMILRECFFGTQRFDRFEAVLKLPRQTLSSRLSALIENGILVRKPVLSGHRYVLSERGRDLYPVMLSLMEFGDRYLAGGRPPPVQLVHLTCGQDCQPCTVCSCCKGALRPHEVHFREGSGAGFSPAVTRPKLRRSARQRELESVRPCSVAQSLSLIGDRWCLLILRESFFGVRRFDEYREKLGIAPGTLSDRLARLTASGVLSHRTAAAGDHNEYRLAPFGRALYPAVLAMMAWGDRWLAPEGAPLRLRHRVCDREFRAEVICSACGEKLTVEQTGYRLSYPEP